MAVLKYGQAAKTTLPTATAPKETAATNGGFWDSVADVGQGIGYLAEKVGLGFLSTFEGMWDYSAGGIASMFGNNEWAEQQFKDDWVDYSHPDTWYQPSDGWKTAGDIASGIGNSAASLVPYGIAAAVSFFSAGTLAPVAFSAASWASVGTAGLGAAGQSTKQAYQETGELGGKEYGYGALTGVTEGALEYVTGGLGVGGEAVVKSLSKTAAKKAAGEAAQVVAKKSIGKVLVDGFVGEAFEEGLSAILEPEYAKLTYNPNAQSATPQEIAYSAFVGGMAGMIMGGASQGISNATTRYQDSKRGKELVKQGKQDSILEMARQIAETERNTPTGDHAFEYTKEAYDKLMQSLATTDGKITNDSQKRMLGEVARWSSFSAFSPMISKSAANIYQNAEAFAERLNAYYSSVGGNMSVTAEDIRNGLDPKDPKTFKTALETNPTLRMLAIADATGHLFLDSTRFAQAAAEGRGIATQDDINRLLETADEAKINALSQRYGVDLRTATASEFNKAVTQYMQSGGYDTEMGEVRRSKAAKGADEKTAKTKLPKAIALKDGETVRYKIGDEDFSITREGDGYYLHDNKTDRATRKLTKAEVNKRLADYRQQSELSKPDTGDNEQKKTAETVDAWAGENVIGYNKLGNADKVGIRRLINTARAMGVSDADIAIYASISARSGVKITFESKPDTDYNGYYSHKDNLITINIAKTKSAESTIIHEFDHAIRTVDGDFYIPVKEAADALTDAEFMQVMEAYSKETAMGKADELTAHGAEKLLAGQGVLTRLMDEQPKLLDRVLAFFKGAESDYKSLPRLSKEAKRYYKKYKKMFDALSYRNAGGRVAAPDASEIRYSKAENADETIRRGNKSDEFARQIDSWDGEKEGFSFHLGDTSAVLAEISVNGRKIGKKQVKIDATKIKKILSDHSNMSLEIIKKLPQLINSPILVMESKTVPGRLVLVGEVYSDEGMPVMAVIELNPKTRAGKSTYANVVKIASAYPRKSLQRLIETSNILYVSENKNRVDNWLKVNRLQLPLPNTQSDSADNSIPQNSADVNPSDENSRRKSKVLPSNSLDESISPENLERTRELKTELFRKMQEAKKKADAVVDKEWDDTFMSRLAELISNDADKAEIDALLEENTRRAEESGYASAKAEYDALNNQYQEAQRVINRIETELSKQLRERVYTEEEASKYASKAARKYRTTSRLKNAAYLTVTGSMLDFSEGQGYRVKDHREIAEVLNLPDYAQYSDGMIVFMNMGNIRLQTYGIDISKMPNAKQISVLRDIIPSVMREYDEFTVDFSTSSGNTDGSVTYPRGIATARIIADIKSYFDTGVVPDEPSSVGSFRYSKVLPSDTEYLAAVERGDMETAQRMVDEAAKMAGYDVTTYHGTDKEFTVFKTLNRNEYGFHTGTIKAAEDRVQYVLNAKVLKLYTNLGNTIRTPDVFGYFAGMHDYIFYVRGETDKVSDMDFLKQLGRTKKLKNKFPSNETLNRLHNAYVEFVESGYKGSKANAVVELTQEYLRSIGVDSIAYTNAYESAGSTSYLLMDSNRVKSADPVTYDDNGNIIPLSERFNSEESDIRYSRSYDLEGQIGMFDEPAVPREATIASGFVQAMRNLVDQNGGWKIGDVFDLLAREYEELDFIHRIHKDKSAKADLEAFLANVDDVSVLTAFRWYMSKAHLHLRDTPYRGATRVFTNAIDRRINEIEAARVGGRNLGIENGEVGLQKVKELFGELNSDKEIGALAERVFATAERLGVNIRFTNTMRRDYMGQAVGDMVEYKTNYFNDEAYTDQSKAGTILHELIHTCTAYAFRLRDNGYTDRLTPQTLEAIQTLDSIFREVKADKAFEGQYGTTSTEEMLAELSDPEFVALLKKKTLWDRILDCLARIFGFRRGNSAYDGAMQCLDRLLDNPDVEAYRRVAYTVRKALDRNGQERFGRTVMPDGSVRYSRPVDFTDEYDIIPSEEVKKGAPVRKTATSRGRVKQKLANHTQSKVYTKEEAEMLASALTTLDVSKKTYGEFVDALWQMLNDYPNKADQKRVARDMSRWILSKMLLESKSPNESSERQTALMWLERFRTGISRLSFREHDISEIRHIIDKDGLKRVLGRWGRKRSTRVVGEGEAARIVPLARYDMSQFVVDVARETPGLAYLEEMHPAEAFLEINRLYEEAKTQADSPFLTAYELLPDEEVARMAAEMEGYILEGFDMMGQKSKFVKTMEEGMRRYTERAEYWKAQYDEIKGRDRIEAMISSRLEKLRNIKNGVFLNATQVKNDVFDRTIGALTRLDFRKKLIAPKKVRAIFAETLSWFTQKDVVQVLDESGFYDSGIEAAMKDLAQGSGKFTKADLQTIYDIVSYFTHIIGNFNKVFRHGQWVDAREEAMRYIDIVSKTKGIKRGIFGRSVLSYLKMFGDPASVMRYADKYAKGGFYTEFYEDLRQAEILAATTEWEVITEYRKFLEENKDYVQNASTKMVTYNGVDMPKIVLITAYMTSKRKHAQAGFMENGFSFKDPKTGNEVKVGGVDQKFTIADVQSQMRMLLDDTDMEYIGIMERAYNGTLRALKTERDMQRLGFTNASDDYYIPIRRNNRAAMVDMDAKSELDRVSNASFNKDTVQGAKQELFIESADVLFTRHAHAVVQYYALSPAVTSFNHIYNVDVSGNPNSPVNLQRAEKQGDAWNGGYAFIRSLIDDIQGVRPKKDDAVTRVLAGLRGGYAKYQLGANPKVWITQLSSFFASSSLLDAASIASGVAVDSSDVDTYCSLAMLRHQDDTAARAQAVDDTIGKRARTRLDRFTNALMKPVGAMDRFVIKTLFGACQVQIERNGDAKVGTVENKTEAGKLLEKVILETQQNAMATERSTAMRSDNEFLKTVTMFSADSMKVIGRVIDSLGEIDILRKQIKAETDPAVKAELKAKLKAANKKARKSIGALTLSAAFMAGVAQLFRWLYDKDDEEPAKTIAVDFAGNLLGGLPLFKDAFAFFAEGYDLENYTYSTINDLFGSIQSLFDTVANWNTMSSQDWASAIRKLSYSVGQVTGLPFRNVYNTLYGLTKRISPTTAYKIDNVFYEKNYKTDLEKAVEEGDADMASMLLGLLYGQRINDNISAATHNELYRLMTNGHAVIPRTIGKTATVDGEEIDLDDAQRSAIKSAYTAYQYYFDDMIASADYRKLSDEDKAYAAKYFYDTTYRASFTAVVGGSTTNTELVADIIGQEVMSVLKAKLRHIEADKDKEGNTVSGTKRAKVLSVVKSMNIPNEQKLLLLCALGYTVKSGDIQGLSKAAAERKLLSYIMKLSGVSKANKEILARVCGFSVKNGKIVMNG